MLQLSIEQKLKQVQQQIQTAANLAQLPPPLLIAVSKTFPTGAILAAHAAGQRSFAENQAQELKAKADELSPLELEWHFIGRLQSNKTQVLAKYATWVHSLTNLKHATRLNQQRPKNLPQLKVLIEVKISPEASKHGLNSFEQVLDLANGIKQLANLELCGLMGMASRTNDQSQIKAEFNQLADFLQRLNQHGFKLKQLSMGMSQDFALAISCGATIVRIGSKIFDTLSL